jgi:hypothetical protein
MAENQAPIGLSQQQPDPALKRLEKLVGTWELKGRTLNSKEDNISGQVVIEWMAGGFFLQQRGEIHSMGFSGYSLEIVGYDPATDIFPSTVYSNMDGVPAAYYWDVQGDIVTHWTKGSKYTGTFSKDGNTLSGGWRPDTGTEENEGNAYDAVMTRVK